MEILVFQGMNDHRRLSDQACGSRIVFYGFKTETLSPVGLR